MHYRIFPMDRFKIGAMNSVFAAHWMLWHTIVGVRGVAQDRPLIVRSDEWLRIVFA